MDFVCGCISCKTAPDPSVPAPSTQDAKLKLIASQARDFVKQQRYNLSICFLVDLSLNSGLSRFFVFDLAKDSVVEKGLVAHGHCKELIQHSIKFSNDPGCNCSSAGRYKVSSKYAGRFGTAYKLIGLDSSNSNAYSRAIVLHGHSCIPDIESYPDPICRSEGCPTVSPAFLKNLSSRIDVSANPILLWVFQ
jgi:hypothetical protein